MFETVFNRVTWDCHGAAPFSTLDDYAREAAADLRPGLLGPARRPGAAGLLETTLVVATGEFGRTPKLNAAGGRDHWPGVWSAVLAGGGIRGGQVVGASDRTPRPRQPTGPSPQDLLATMYHSLGISRAQYLQTAAGESFALVEDVGRSASCFLEGGET